MTIDGKELEGQKLDELIGLARGLTADGEINQAEVEFLAKRLVSLFVVVFSAEI